VKRRTIRTVLRTGQRRCYDSEGREIECASTSQDGALQPGVGCSGDRFEPREGVALDNLTGLMWTRDANPAEFPLTWREALDYVDRLNRQKHLDFNDWRLPNRRELRSLISYQTRNPALPEDHPFENLFMGWYWTGTTAAINPAYAWYVHFEGGRMFYGKKDQSYLLWPVRGSGSGVLAATGQKRCFDSHGGVTPCSGSGQDGGFRAGVPWPTPRFEEAGDAVVDRLTGLRWLRSASLTEGPVSWREAFDSVKELNAGGSTGARQWRLPTINELESLVDADRHSPALPEDHPFREVRDAYWSSTSSAFEPDWAMALYLMKGAVGVGQKKGEHFHAWAVSSD